MQYLVCRPKKGTWILKCPRTVCVNQELYEWQVMYRAWRCEKFLGPRAGGRKLTGGRKELLNEELHNSYTSQNRPDTSVNHIKEVEMDEVWSTPSHSGGPWFKSWPPQGSTCILVTLLRQMPG